MKNPETAIEANEHYHDRVAAKYDHIYMGKRWDCLLYTSDAADE